MCRGGGFAPTSRKWKDSRGSSFTAAALEALLCSTHLWTTNCASHTGTKETKEPRTGGEAQCSCGAEPTQRGPRGGWGRARDTRPRGPSGLRGSCPAAGAVPQRSEGGVFFVFVSLCVGGRGCNGRGPKTTPVRGNGRYHKACRGLRACGRVPPLFLLPPPLPPRPAFEAMTDVQLALAGDCVFTQGVGSGRAGQAAGARAGAVTCRRPGHRLQAQAGKGSGLCDSFTH